MKNHIYALSAVAVGSPVFLSQLVAQVWRFEVYGAPFSNSF